MEEVSTVEIVRRIEVCVADAAAADGGQGGHILVLGQLQFRCLATYLMALGGARRVHDLDSTAFGLPLLTVDKDDYLAVVKEVRHDTGGLG